MQILQILFSTTRTSVHTHMCAHRYLYMYIYMCIQVFTYEQQQTVACKKLIKLTNLTYIYTHMCVLTVN